MFVAFTEILLECQPLLGLTTSQYRHGGKCRTNHTAKGPKRAATVRNTSSQQGPQHESNTRHPNSLSTIHRAGSDSSLTAPKRRGLGITATSTTEAACHYTPERKSVQGIILLRRPTPKPPTGHLAQAWRQRQYPHVVESYGNQCKVGDTMLNLLRRLAAGSGRVTKEAWVESALRQQITSLCTGNDFVSGAKLPSFC